MNYYHTAVFDKYIFLNKIVVRMEGFFVFWVSGTRIMLDFWEKNGEILSLLGGCLPTNPTRFGYPASLSLLPSRGTLSITDHLTLKISYTSPQCLSQTGLTLLIPRKPCMHNSAFTALRTPLSR